MKAKELRGAMRGPSKCPERCKPLSVVNVHSVITGAKTIRLVVQLEDGSKAWIDIPSAMAGTLHSWIGRDLRDLWRLRGG